MDSGTDHPRSTHLPCSLWEPNSFCPCGSLERNWLQPFLGLVADSRKSSRAEGLVESQAAEKDCLVLPEPFSSEFSTPSPENSIVAGNAE